MTNTTNPSPDHEKLVAEAERRLRGISELDSGRRVSMEPLVAKNLVKLIGDMAADPAAAGAAPQDGALAASARMTPEPMRGEIVQDCTHNLWRRNHDTGLWKCATTSAVATCDWEHLRDVGGPVRVFAEVAPQEPHGDYHEGLQEGIKIGRTEMKPDPEKVAEVINRLPWGYMVDGPSVDEIAGALCEAAKRGELS